MGALLSVHSPPLPGKKYQSIQHVDNDYIVTLLNGTQISMKKMIQHSQSRDYDKNITISMCETDYYITILNECSFMKYKLGDLIKNVFECKETIDISSYDSVITKANDTVIEMKYTHKIFFLSELLIAQRSPLQIDGINVTANDTYVLSGLKCISVNKLISDWVV